MFYINSHKKYQPITEKAILNAILVPPEERLAKDHQVIYRFFNDNHILKQLERTKSLNARIKCVAAMLIIKKEDFNQEYHLIMHMLEDERVIVLPKEVKDNAENFNQKLIRRKMDLLNKFTMFKLLKYEQLLYLAFNLEEQSCKYKQYLYREGDLPEYAFLIVDGQFHYVKDLNMQPIVHKKSKHKQESTLKSLEGEEESPNKYVKPQVNRYKVGIVQGNLGQTVGLQQIVIQQYKQSRRYSVVCNSAQSNYIKIHKKYFDILFEQLPFYHHQIMNQVIEADSIKNQLLHKIKATKLNLKQYLKKSNEKLPTDSEEHYSEYKQIQEMRSFQKINQTEPNRYKIALNSKTSTLSNDYRSRSSISALTVGLKREEEYPNAGKHKSSLGHPISKQSQDEDHFALTSIKQKKILQLPLIGKRSMNDFEEKSNQVTLILQQPKSRFHKYGSMIDSSKLLEQKQHIMEKKFTKAVREEIFPIGSIQLKNPKQPKMVIKSSPVHSNRFMENMLLKVLKKVGYDEAVQEVNKQVRQADKTQNNTKPIHKQLHRSMSRYKKRQSIKTNQELLVDSPFDDCYFTKI